MFYFSLLSISVSPFLRVFQAATSLKFQKLSVQTDVVIVCYSWNISGGHLSEMCGVVHSGVSLVFSGEEYRSVCTPYIDATNAGNMRFYFTLGMDSSNCSSAHFHRAALAQTVCKHNKILLTKIGLAAKLLWVLSVTVILRICAQQKIIKQYFLLRQLFVGPNCQIKDTRR